MELFDFKTALLSYLEGKEVKLYTKNEESGIEHLIPIDYLLSNLKERQYVITGGAAAAVLEGSGKEPAKEAEPEKKPVKARRKPKIEETEQKPKEAEDVDVEEEEPAPMPKRKYTQRKYYRNGRVDSGKLEALYRAGWDIPKIADELGCSTQTVRNHIANIIAKASPVQVREGN